LGREKKKLFLLKKFYDYQQIKQKEKAVTIRVMIQETKETFNTDFQHGSERGRWQRWDKAKQQSRSSCVRQGVIERLVCKMLCFHGRSRSTRQFSFRSWAWC